MVRSHGILSRGFQIGWTKSKGITGREYYQWDFPVLVSLWVQQFSLICTAIYALVNGEQDVWHNKIKDLNRSAFCLSGQDAAKRKYFFL